MVKISRFVLVIIGVIVTAMAIPDLYWTIFQESRPVPNVMFSHVIDDFIIVQPGEDGVIRKDASGNTYTSEEVEQKLPLMFFSQLAADGTMPDSLKGVPMDHATISTHRGSYSYIPRNINTPEPVLLPLIEAESGRVGLSLPEDFFRLKNRIEFIVAETNEVDKEKSRIFNDALLEKGFSFPAQLIAGIPTVMKSKDEGYFIKDDEGDLYHLKKIRGEPYVARIDIPEDMDIVFIESVDMRTEEFYAYLYTEDNEVYVILDEVYYLQKLPVEGFDRNRDRLRIRHDLFGKTISVIGEDFMKVIRIDDVYEVIDTYETTWEPRHERPDHRMFARLFPFEIRLEIPDSRYVGFFFNFAHGYSWLLLNLLFVALAIWLIKRKGRDIRKNIPDLFVILLAGFFGFIATRVFPNKFYE